MLGQFEVDGRGRQSCEAGLQARGTLVGADALINVRDANPKAEKATHRMTGTAVRAIDAEGQAELRLMKFRNSTLFYSKLILNLLRYAL